jgi:hypothetical protein
VFNQGKMVFCTLLSYMHSGCSTPSPTFDDIISIWVFQWVFHGITSFHDKWIMIVSTFSCTYVIYSEVRIKSFTGWETLDKLFLWASTILSGKEVILFQSFGLSSGPHACKAGTLPLETLSQPCLSFSFLFVDRVLCFCSGWDSGQDPPTYL